MSDAHVADPGPGPVDSGPVLSSPFIRYDVGDAPYAGTEFAWPLEGCPFRFATFDDFCGAYLAPSFWLTREYASVDLRTPSPFGLGGQRLDTRGLADGEALYRVLQWGSVPGPDGQRLAPSLAWLVRVLSVVYWVACPREMVSRAQGALPVTGARLLVQPIMCPGGNLSTLLLLGWRAVRDASVALFAELESGPGAEAGRYSESMERALMGLGPVPAYPLTTWSDVASRHELVVAYPTFAWGVKSLGSMAERSSRRIAGVSGTPFKPNAYRSRRFQTFDTFDKKMNWDRTLGHNLSVYSGLCARVLAEVVVALRILSHVVHLLRVVKVYRYESVTYRPRRWSKILKWYADLDLACLDGLFHDLAKAGSLPVPWLWHCERELESMVIRAAPFALHEMWGIPFDQPDSLDRAGASCPDNGRYFAPYAASKD